MTSPTWSDGGDVQLEVLRQQSDMPSSRVTCHQQVGDVVRGEGVREFSQMENDSIHCT